MADAVETMLSMAQMLRDTQLRLARQVEDLMGPPTRPPPRVSTFGVTVGTRAPAAPRASEPQEPEQGAALECLPGELLAAVLTPLSLLERVRLAAASRRLRALILSSQLPSLWRTLSFEGVPRGARAAVDGVALATLVKVAGEGLQTVDLRALPRGGALTPDGVVAAMAAKHLSAAPALLLWHERTSMAAVDASLTAILDAISARLDGDNPALVALHAPAALVALLRAQNTDAAVLEKCVSAIQSLTNSEAPGASNRSVQCMLCGAHEVLVVLAMTHSNRPDDVSRHALHALSTLAIAIKSSQLCGTLIADCFPFVATASAAVLAAKADDELTATFAVHAISTYARGAVARGRGRASQFVAPVMATVMAAMARHHGSWRMQASGATLLLEHATEQDVFNYEWLGAAAAALADHSSPRNWVVRMMCSAVLQALRARDDVQRQQMMGRLRDNMRAQQLGNTAPHRLSDIRTTLPPDVAAPFMRLAVGTLRHMALRRPNPAGSTSGASSDHEEDEDEEDDGASAGGNYAESEESEEDVDFVHRSCRYRCDVAYIALELLRKVLHPVTGGISYQLAADAGAVHALVVCARRAAAVRRSQLATKCLELLHVLAGGRDPNDGWSDDSGPNPYVQPAAAPHVATAAALARAFDALHAVSAAFPNSTAAQLAVCGCVAKLVPHWPAGGGAHVLVDGTPAVPDAAMALVLRATSSHESNDEVCDIAMEALLALVRRDDACVRYVAEHGGAELAQSRCDSASTASYTARDDAQGVLDALARAEARRRAAVAPPPASADAAICLASAAAAEAADMLEAMLAELEPGSGASRDAHVALERVLASAAALAPFVGAAAAASDDSPAA